ncbi:MAG: chemotaxis protein CheD [Clostridiales bacterium]|nr:chemotaxis protein CheD [Clostridiales bacterium]
MVTIGISDLNIATPPNILVTYALGSCIGICLHDKAHNIGGLAHIMLPSSKEATKASDNLRRYADTGIEELVNLLKSKGVLVSSLTAKIAGGAQMFQTNCSTFNIGARNITAVKQVLAKYRIPIIAEDTGLNFGRTVFFDVATGVMQVKSVNQGVVNL